ncbi:hypothetical protein [Pseudomonas sp. Pseusp16]|uniref:hypothetical protein n=1 Tax=Pseudomonas sp. Pseusp16 TaxID=3243021 RepID=UPI0039B6C0A7
MLAEQRQRSLAGHERLRERLRQSRETAKGTTVAARGAAKKPGQGAVRAGVRPAS